MVPLTALWAPILLSAVIVFVASSILHMVLRYHRNDYRQLPDEDKVLAALRPAGLKPGLYTFPYTTHEEMKSPAVQEKFKQGPVGYLTIFPSGPIKLQKFLGLWFVYCLIVSFFVAYLTAHVIGPSALPARVSHRRHRRVHGVRRGNLEQRNLEGPALEQRDQGSDRWPHLRPAHRGHLRLALASLASHGLCSALSDSRFASSHRRLAFRRKRELLFFGRQPCHSNRHRP